MNKKNALIVFLALAIIIFSYNSAATLGVSPATLLYQNMLRAGFSQRAIVISTLSDSMVVELTPGGDIYSWINFSESNFVIATNKSKSVFVIIRPPKDIPNGNYSGFITITRRSENISDKITGIGNVVIMSIKVPVDVQITDREISACTAYSFSIDSIEENNPSKLKLFLRNDGNVRIGPLVRLDIWDQERQTTVKFLDFIPASVLPSIDEQIEFALPLEDLPIGQYWADLSVDDCYASEVLTFDVMEKGALSTMGRLIQIKANTWIDAFETAKIEAVFRNEGKKTVSARFKGTVSYGGQILSVIESESVSVSPDETISLTTFFKPEQPGRYVVDGKVYYDKKFTFPASTIINVREKKGFSFSLLTLLYILIAGASLFFLFAIFRKRRKHRRF
jgi:hypothetical protein